MWVSLLGEGEVRDIEVGEYWDELGMGMVVWFWVGLSYLLPVCEVGTDHCDEVC
jgi:hypothetical protein